MKDITEANGWFTYNYKYGRTAGETSNIYVQNHSVPKIYLRQPSNVLRLTYTCLHIIKQASSGTGLIIIM